MRVSIPSYKQMFRVSLILVGRSTRLHLGVGDVTPNPEPHPVTAPVSNADIEVKQHGEGPDDIESPALPTAVCHFLISALPLLTGHLHNIDRVGFSY